MAFLASPPTVRTFVSHKRLEFFNARLQATSPPILLGVSRADGPDVRARACDAWAAFQAEMVALLPPRVRRGVDGVVTRRFDEAVAGYRQQQGMTPPRDRSYDDDRARLRELIVEYSTARFRAAGLLMRAADRVGQLGSFAGVVELLGLDRVPFDSGPEYFLAAAGRYGGDTERLKGLLVECACQLVLAALRFVLDPPADDADGLRRRQLFGKIVEQVVPDDRFVGVVPVVDSPHNLPTFREKWLAADPATNLAVYRRWHRAFPAMAGVALRYAHELIEASHGAAPEQNRATMAEVVEVLDAGCRHGFYEPTVTVCVENLAAIHAEQGRGQAALDLVARYRDQATSDQNRTVLARLHVRLRFKAAFDQERFDEAVGVGIELLAFNAEDDKDARALLQVVEKAAERTRADPGVGRAREAIEAWAGRADAHREKHKADPNATTASRDAVLNVRSRLDETTVVVALHALADEEGNRLPEEVVTAMTELLDARPNLTTARFHRMLAWQAIAEEPEADPAAAAVARDKARTDAREVAAHARDARQRAAANKLLKPDTP